jgi:XRE family aerobic/anaerobic benzoate catabolism transcriptional regulator
MKYYEVNCINVDLKGTRVEGKEGARDAQGIEGSAGAVLGDLGRAVRSLRQARDWSIRELARTSGLSERFVSGVEGGRTNISVASLVGLSRALGVRPGDLLVGDASAASSKKVVALLGLRGAGKTSVGRLLANRMQVQFFELDRLIEAQAGMQLSEIFAFHGEEYFRQVELAVLDRFLVEHQTGVLATGGGVVTSPDAYRLLSEHTRTVWLKASPKEHWTRVVKQGDLRPIENRPHAMAELRRRLKKREPLYARAQIVCATSGLSLECVVSQLARQLGEPELSRGLRVRHSKRRAVRRGPDAADRADRS